MSTFFRSTDRPTDRNVPKREKMQEAIREERESRRNLGPSSAGDDQGGAQVVTTNEVVQSVADVDERDSSPSETSVPFSPPRSPPRSAPSSPRSAEDHFPLNDDPLPDEAEAFPPSEASDEERRASNQEDVDERDSSPPEMFVPFSPPWSPPRSPPSSPRATEWYFPLNDDQLPDETEAFPASEAGDEEQWASNTEDVDERDSSPLELFVPFSPPWSPPRSPPSSPRTTEWHFPLNDDPLSDETEAFSASEVGDEERRASNPEARWPDAGSNDDDNGIAAEIRLESSYRSSSVTAPSSTWTLLFPSVSPSLRATSAKRSRGIESEEDRGMDEDRRKRRRRSSVPSLVETPTRTRCNAREQDRALQADRDIRRVGGVTGDPCSGS